MLRTARQPGFTIVELLIVIVVIAILAAITIVSYNGIAQSAKEAVLKSDLRNGASQLEIAKATSGAYPSDANSIQKSDTTTLTYIVSGNNFCLEATGADQTGKSFYTSQAGSIQEGPCPTASDGAFMQTINPVNCPTTRIRAVDARDNHTYWVQKLADGKCWMLTNLAYAGGGNNTYSDTISTAILEEATSGNTYTSAKYYIPTGSNVTSEPTAPSTSTNGIGQYGYLYNFCAANGGQADTEACSSSSTTPLDKNISICPAGWKLPTSTTIGTSDFGTLDDIIRWDYTINWLGQYSGRWANAYYDLGTEGYYWSLTTTAIPSVYGNLYHIGPYGTGSLGLSYSGKSAGNAVRCIAVY